MTVLNQVQFVFRFKYCSKLSGFESVNQRSLSKTCSFSNSDVPDQVRLCSGSIDVSHDGNHLFTAGQNGALLFDVEKWEVLFDRAELEGFSH